MTPTRIANEKSTAPTTTGSCSGEITTAVGEGVIEGVAVSAGVHVGRGVEDSRGVAVRVGVEEGTGVGEAFVGAGVFDGWMMISSPG